MSMEMNSSFAEGSFANPNVDEDISTAVVEYFEAEGASYPWDVICTVAEQENVSKKTVRKALRKLRMNNYVVPAPPFTGKMELCL